MTISTDDLLSSILASLERIEYVKLEDVPDIDLYMDQVTTFMDRKMKNSTRNPEEDKILTKTMINNYAKNDLLPPPIRKKYSKEHVLVLIFIYYFKGILSIGDIQKLLSPLTDRYFGKKGSYDLQEIYEEVFGLEKEQVENLKKDVEEKFRRAADTFPEAEGEEREFLKQFSFICLLSFDVYVKKLLIEKMIDEMASSLKKAETKKAEGKKTEPKKADVKKAEAKKPVKESTNK